jgi:hypothetical protein
MKELKDTIEMMTSEDYKERFKAEYLQTKIRRQKLSDMLAKHDAGTLPFTPTCPIWVLKSQETTMGQYLDVLELRARLEGVDLEVNHE